MVCKAGIVMGRQCLATLLLGVCVLLCLILDSVPATIADKQQQ